MPAKSKKQQMFMGAELARKRAGQKTTTGMSEGQLKDFASTARKGLPKSKSPNLKSSKEEMRKYVKGKKKK